MRLNGKQHDAAVRQRIVALRSKEPELTNKVLAERTGASRHTVEQVLKAAGLGRPRKVGGRKEKRP